MIASWVLQLLVALTILWLVLGSIVLLDYVGWLWRRSRRSPWRDAERSTEAERNELAERIRAKWPHRGPS